MKHFARFAVALALLLPGCLNYQQHAVLSEDGSGTLSIHYSIAENVMSWMESGNLSFTEDKVREQYSGEGIDITSVRVNTEADDSSRHVRVELDFDEIGQLSLLKGFQNMEFRWLREGDVFRFSQKIGANNSSSDASLDAFKVTYSYEFPGDILESNADSTDGRTAFWVLKLSQLNEDHVLTARIAASSGGNVLWVLAVLAVVVALIIILALLRRRK